MLTYDISERARRAAIMSAVTQPQGNKTQPPGRKNVTLEKSSWRAPVQWYGAGEVNFSLDCVLSPGCIFVCVFIIQILYVVLQYRWIAIAVHCIYGIQYQYACVYVLLDQRARARAASDWLNGQYA